jgi:hypothetical protein
MLNNTETVVNAVRYAVKARGAWKTFVTENSITRDMIADTARELAALAYPNDEPVQKTDGKRTRFGNAVQAAGNGMRSVLNAEESDDTDKTPDYLALAVEAAKRAHDKGEVAYRTIVDALVALDK